MTHAQHTPGPWVIKRSSDYTGDDDDTQIMSIEAQDGTTILFTDSGYFKPKEANAHLIASAPELLRALKMFANFEKTIGWVEGECDNWMGDALFHAKQAIAKAEGRG